MSFGNNNDQSNNKNLFIALGLFMVFMFGYNYLFEDNNKTAVTPQSVVSNENKDVTDGEDSDGSVSNDNEEKPKLTVVASLAKQSRIYIENTKVKALIDLQGSVIDSITLKDYKKTTDKDSENIDLFIPKDTENECYYSISYNDKTHLELIDSKAVWEKVVTADKNYVSGQSVTLKTQTKNGLVIERTITLDENYLFTINDKLINISDKPIKISNSADIVKKNPMTNNYAVVHEGLIGVNQIDDNKVQEIKYTNVNDKTELGNSKWFGYTDIYWLTSHINTSNKNVMSYSKINDNEYKCSMHSKSGLKIKEKSAVDLKYSIFAGPKDLRLLKGYQKTMNIEKFDMAIDFGWFFMITKPLLTLLDIMANIFSNMGVVVLLLTLMFKIATYPLMKKSFTSAAKMREVQPRIAALQKSYAHDKQRMNQELMALYKKEQISPLSGCLPMLLQAPIFFCLYKVFFISIEMRHAPLFGWIKDMAAPDQLYIFNLFGAIDWMPPKLLQIGVWPLIMGVTMLLQQKLSAAKNKSVEKTQEAKIQENMMYALPVIFTYICSSFPVGVVIYWTISNVFSIIQQQYANTHIKGKKVCKK